MSRELHMTIVVDLPEGDVFSGAEHKAAYDAFVASIPGCKATAKVVKRREVSREKDAE